MWLVLGALVALGTCVARPVLPHQSLLALGLSESEAVPGQSWALMSISSPEVNYGDKISIVFQRVMKENATEREHDIIGLYYKPDARVFNPWNWEKVDANLEAGTVTMDANKAGDMELRFVRPPNSILAKVPVFVNKPCNPTCYKHGTCIKGECHCNDGYAPPLCGSPDGANIIVEPFDKDMGKEFQVGLPINVVVTQIIPVEMNGKDYIGIYPANSENGTAALSWKAVPQGNVSKVEMIGMKKAGDYVVRFTRFEDILVLAESKPFTVYEYCPRQCSGHGKCMSGRCFCDQDWSLADCSLGPALVNLTLIYPVASPHDLLKNEEVVVRFSRLFDPEYPSLLGDSDWIGMYATNDTDWNHPFAYQYAQMNHETVELPVQSGEVRFIVPPGVVNLVFQYIRNDHIFVARSDQAHVFQPCIAPNCSDHGDCVEGLCVCDAGWKGEICNIGDTDCEISCTTHDLLVGDSIVVSFAHGQNNGTTFDFVGLYNSSSVDNSEGLLDWVHANLTKEFAGPDSNMASGVVTLIPRVHGKFQVRYVDIYSKTTSCQTEEFEVYPRCPENCSGAHGTCLRGECKCGEDWLGPDCKRHVGVVTITAPSRVVMNPNELAKTNLTATINVPEGWHNSGDFVGFYPAPENEFSVISVSSVIAYQVAPPTADINEVQISFLSLLPPGMYYLWYVNGRNYQQIATSRAFEIVPDCGTGSFDLVEHKCVCPEGKTGRVCEADTCCWELVTSTVRAHPNDNVTITWKRPTKNGRDMDIIGLYLHNATNFETPYAYQFAIGNGTDSGTVVLAMPNVEESFSVHYISLNNNYTSKESTEPIAIVIPCDPEDCSGHGVCISGACMCTSEFGGAKCDKPAPLEPTLTVEAEGVIGVGAVFNVRYQRPPDVGSTGDYLGIFKRLESNRPYSYVYVPIDKESFEGVVQMTAPGITGTFQVRWLSKIQV